MFGLYLLDVYVSQLSLNKEVYIDTGGAQLLAKVVFLNFPTTETKERSRFRKEDDDIYVYQFNNGQSIHFSMTGEELLMKMKRIPLSIGIFKVDDSYPICSLKTHLSGCACDLGSQRIENPASFKFRGPFELIDSGKTFAGQLDLDITISNLGRCLLTYYGLAPKCFVFKNEPKGSEYKCNIKDPSPEMQASYTSNLTNIGDHMAIVDTSPPGNLIKDIAGISPVADRLGEGSPPPKPPFVPLVDPSAKQRKSRKKKRGRRRK